MATKGTPLAGRSELARRAYVLGPAIALVAYTNPANSLGDSTVMSDLLQPPLANGYAPIQLSGTWSIVNGVATYVHTDGLDPGWSCTDDWAGGITAVGAAMVFGVTVIHFKDLAAPFVALKNKKLRISISNLTGP